MQIYVASPSPVRLAPPVRQIPLDASI